jgi:PAS domain S-box-containing protein
MLSVADFSVYAMSLDQRIVFWNQGARRILGYTANEVVGRHCYEVVTGRPLEGLAAACQGGCPSIRSFQGRTIPSMVSMEMLCASGERKTVSVTPMIVSGAVGEGPLLVHLFQDRDEGMRERPAMSGIGERLSGGGLDIVSDRAAAGAAPASSAALTERELEVLHLVALGRGTMDIAEELGISQHTVRNHVRHFRSKLDASTKLEAVLTALRLGILGWSDDGAGPVARQ